MATLKFVFGEINFNHVAETLQLVFSSYTVSIVKYYMYWLLALALLPNYKTYASTDDTCKSRYVQYLMFYTHTHFSRNFGQSTNW